MKAFLTSCLFLVILSLSAQEHPDKATKGLKPIVTKGMNTGQNYAVVVGISDYQDDGIPDLRFADKDAEAFAGFLQSPSGGSLDNDHLKVFLNEKATVAQFATALDWLWEVVKEGDNVIIYFSGHGDVEKKSLTQPGFLLCWDAPAKVYLAGGTLALPMFQEVISTLSVQNKARVIVITDACRAGKLSGSSVGGSQLTSHSLAKQYTNEIKILSCQPDEYSLEGEQWGGGRGAFSYHLLDGLYGLADSNGDNMVNLKEIGRYLEDRVSEEVAPHNQNPMAIGRVTEKIADVYPEILAQLKDGENEYYQVFAATESRGIEENVLASADTNVVELYYTFKESLSNKNFLLPAGDCAEFYYEKLIQEQQLKSLHSTIKRNYAAALQDDAQQVMNNWLKTDINRTTVVGARRRKGRVSQKVYSDKIKSFPLCLQRAAELLGENHYMYSTLQARKCFFEGYLLTNSNLNPDKELGELALKHFREALRWEPELPPAYWQISRVFGYQFLEPDSMEYYTEKAMEQHPSWLSPYISTSHILTRKYRQYDRAKYLLEQAEIIDSTSSYLWNNWGVFYQKQRMYPKAIDAYKKAIQIDSTYDSAYSNLGNVYQYTGQIEEAEKAYLKAMQLDSTSAKTYNNLAGLYSRARRYSEAEKAYKNAVRFNPTDPYAYTGLGVVFLATERTSEAKRVYRKAIELDSTFVEAYNNLGNVYIAEERFSEAAEEYNKAIFIDSTFALPYSNLGVVFRKTNRYDEAEMSYNKVIQIDSTIWFPYANLGSLYQRMDRWEESETLTQKAIDLAPPVAGLVSQLGNSYTHIPSRFEEAESTLMKALEMDPNNADTHIHLAQFSIMNNNLEDAFNYLQQGFEKGVGKGELSFDDLQTEPDFEELKMDERWKELMKKYFVDKIK